MSTDIRVLIVLAVQMRTKLLRKVARALYSLGHVGCCREMEMGGCFCEVQLQCLYDVYSYYQPLKLRARSLVRGIFWYPRVVNSSKEEGRIQCWENRTAFKLKVHIT